MAESKLRELSTDFAVKVIKFCETIKGHYSLVNQLERSAASIGANIHEANYEHGKPDFIAKLQIALGRRESNPSRLTNNNFLFFLASSLVIRQYYCILRHRPDKKLFIWQVKEFLSDAFL